MQETKEVLSYEEIIDYFLQHECTIEEAVNTIKICPDLFNMSKEEMDRKVSLIFNADIFYGIIVCNQNDCKEYVYSQANGIGPSQNLSFVTQSFIDTVNKQYIQQILQILPNDTLEDKLYKLKQATLNSSGYKVK